MALIDAHIHLHDCYDPTDFFDAAEHNFRRLAGQSSGDSSSAGILVFTEAAGEKAFERLQLTAQCVVGGYTESQIAPWSVHSTGENLSVQLTRGKTTVTVIAGRQIAAKEGLEILLIGSKQDISDGLGIDEVLDRTEDSEVVRIVPWGAGKWLFARARLLTRLIKDHAGGNLYLGDESARPWFWPKPSHISKAAKLGIFNLPGTDPLPFSGEHGKVGGYGFEIDFELGDRPAINLVRAIRALEAQPDTYGRAENAMKFVHNQVRMQIRKRRS